jgi:hypothetical protein
MRYRHFVPLTRSKKRLRLVIPLVRRASAVVGLSAYVAVPAAVRGRRTSRAAVHNPVHNPVDIAVDNFVDRGVESGCDGIRSPSRDAGSESAEGW